LKCYLAVVLLVYVITGRPKINVELLYGFEPEKLKTEPNPWLDLIGKSLAPDVESHVLKAIRSLLKADSEWGGGETNMFLKSAQLVYEGFQKFSWSFGGPGFEETWKRVKNVENETDIKKSDRLMSLL